MEGAEVVADVLEAGGDRGQMGAPQLRVETHLDDPGGDRAEQAPGTRRRSRTIGPVTPPPLIGRRAPLRRVQASLAAAPAVIRCADTDGTGAATDSCGTGNLTWKAATG